MKTKCEEGHQFTPSKENDDILICRRCGLKILKREPNVEQIFNEKKCEV